jgi:predicted DNA-binding ribbon-helix-helix protein
MDGATIRDGLTSDRRTRIRLEIASWEALYDVARRKGCSVNALVAEINRERTRPNLSAAIRSYVVAYYPETAGRTFDARSSTADSPIEQISNSRPAPLVGGML